MDDCLCVEIVTVTLFFFFACFSDIYMYHTYTHIPQQTEIFPGGLGGRTEIDLILNQDGERETRGDSPPSLPPVAASSYNVCAPKKKEKKKGKKVQRLAVANNTV